MSLLREANAEPIPGYRLIEPLGTGGFGEVWKCEAPGGLFKAIKFVYGNLESSDGDHSRAEQELSALNKVKEIRHPFVLSLDRIQVVEGELAIVMELADKSLHDRFLECQAAGLVGIPRDDLLRYLRDAAEALDHMIGKHHLQHLDIKPRNLFLMSDRVKVADFGLVKQLERQSGILTGVTPLYAAPETYQGRVSEHSDQYSLAIVYCELLTGQRPFNGKTPRQLVLQHTQESPELRTLPEAERPVVSRALAKEPAQRWPNCMAFVRALYTARNPQRVESPEASPNGAAEDRPRSMVDTMEGVFLAPSPDVNGAAEPDAGALEESRLGITVNLPDTGALRPTLILGLGDFGRSALGELRGRFVDRFGDLDRVPVIRFLYVDPDPEASRCAARGGGELALPADAVCHLPLQPVGNYRRRSLEQISEWLPREKLYALPRSLQTEGSRALGRLAFAENHLRFLARLRREVQQAMHPDSLYEAVSGTGLALRDNRPRVYVVAAAGGGTSGLTIDLGFGLRRLLAQMNQAQAEVHLLLFCGAPEDPASPRAEQANVYATLTELNHFADPAVRFTAQYGADGPRTVEQGSPFDQVYLLRLPHRSPEALRDAVAHLGSYLFHELTTPLGLRLDRLRLPAVPPGRTPFRGFGTFGIWFPRGLLLRAAARKACARLLADWQRGGEPSAGAEVEAACARALADPELRFETVCVRIQEAAAESIEDGLTGALTALLSALEEQSKQSVALDDPPNWAHRALGRVEEWVGTRHISEQESGWRRSRLGRALSAGVQKLAGEWDARLASAAFGLMEHPGLRVAAAEAAMDRLTRFAQDTANQQHALLEQQMKRTAQAGLQLARALENCQAGGGFSLFGGGTRRHLRVYVDHLAAFGRQRLVEEVVAAGILFFTNLASRLADRLRELAVCRQRLRHVQEALDGLPPEDTDKLNGAAAGMEFPGSSPTPATTDAYWEIVRESNTAHPVLPNGEKDLDRAAAAVIDRLEAEQWTRLDQALQDEVLSVRGGLHRACLAAGHLVRSFAEPLVRCASGCLGDQLPAMDVAEAELSAAAGEGEDLATRAREYHQAAAPLLAPDCGAEETAFLLLPSSSAGKEFGEAAQRAVDGLELIKLAGQAELMFCREQGYLKPDELRHVFRTCRQAYEESAPVPAHSPHARFDILDWVPLDP